MISALRAELYLQLRRRVVRGTAIAMAALATVLVVFRFLSSSTDIVSAVRTAETEAAALTEMFGDVTTTAYTYVEPRYMFAGQFPHDLAGVLIGFALLSFVGGALLSGGDWRTRAVGATFTRRSPRSVPAVARVVVFAASATVVAVFVASVLTGLMVAVAVLRGSVSGADLAGAGLMIARGGLVVLAGAGAGATLGTLLRSDVTVVVLLLTYVLVVETLLPVFVMGLRTPAAVLHTFLRSEDLSRASTFVCDVPRCPEPVLAGTGSWVGHAVLVVVVISMLLVTWLAARRPVWR